MGHYAHAELGVKDTVVNYWASVLGLPEVRYDEGWLGWLTANDVKKWDDFELPDFLVKVDGWDLERTLHGYAQFTRVCAILHEHATEYIYQATCEADKQELKGKERKNFLRKKTKEYKLVFA